MNRFSKETEEMLKKYGWTEGRTFDASKQIEVLKKEGYPVFDQVEKVLQEFGGLSLPIKGADPQTSYFHFYADKAAESVCIEKLNIYSKIINKKLGAIGEAYRGHEIMMIADDGSVYGGFDDFFRKIGTSIEEAIENLYLCNKTEKIPYNYEYRDNYEKYFGTKEGYIWQKEQ